MSVLVNIDVPDLEAALSFYRDGLGLEGARRFGAFAAELRAGTTHVYLLRKRAGTPATPTTTTQRDYARHWTPVHLDFVTTSLETAVARAEAAGARVETSVESHPWGRIVGLADPWGNGFCLLEFSEAGYDAIAD
jgi:catechol 2,3-dioxygenase-like lactoylglutathione lyase family enzyme